MQIQYIHINLKLTAVFYTGKIFSSHFIVSSSHTSSNITHCFKNTTKKSRVTALHWWYLEDTDIILFYLIVFTPTASQCGKIMCGMFYG